MNTDKKELPKFVRDASIKELKACEELIVKIYKKLSIITKAVQTQKFTKPTTFPPVASIVSRTAVSALAIKAMIKEHEDKIELETYLNTMEEIISDLEISVIANSVNFFNAKLLKHYQKVTNIVLIETKIMDIMNYCTETLDEKTVVEDANRDD